MKRFDKYMVRPMLYMAAFRLMIALIFLLAVIRFVPKGPSLNMAAAFLTVLFGLLAFLVYLRMDGIGVPRMKYIRPKKRRDPMRHLGNMSDYADEEPVTFEELEDDEKDLCSFWASVINLAVFLILSFI